MPKMSNFVLYYKFVLYICPCLLSLPTFSDKLVCVDMDVLSVKLFCCPYCSLVLSSSFVVHTIVLFFHLCCRLLLLFFCLYCCLLLSSSCSHMKRTVKDPMHLIRYCLQKSAHFLSIIPNKVVFLSTKLLSSQ